MKRENVDDERCVAPFSSVRTVLRPHNLRFTLPIAMKAIWTILFLACIGATFGIAFLLVPEPYRGDRFWLCTGGVLLALLLSYLTIAFLPEVGGRQGQEVLRFQSTMGSAAYLAVTLGLAALSLTGIGFNWLAVLHILALLVWVLIIGLGALGSEAARRADELTK